MSDFGFDRPSNNNGGDYNDLENKPCYSITEEEEVILNTTTFTFVDNGVDECFYSQETLNSLILELGSTYRVTYNGTDYECVAQLFEYDDDVYYLGSLSVLWGTGANTGEPFLFEVYASHDYQTNVTTNVAQDMVVEITKINKDIKKLDIDLLPDTVATKQYVDEVIEGIKYAEELITLVSEEQVTEIYNATGSYHDECVHVPTLNLQADKWYMIELYGKTAMAQARIVTEDDYDYESRVIANGTSVILDFEGEGFGWYKENNQIVPYNRIVDKQRCEGDGGHNNYFEDETVTSICFARDLIWGIHEEYPDNYEDISSDFKLYEILNYNSIPSSALQSNINIRESLSINNKPVATKEYIEQAIASMFTFLDNGTLKVTLNGQTYYYSPMDI